MKTKKCKPVLIESKENTGITLGINITKNIPGAMRGQNYQLILISLEDEKIEVGDKWIYICPINGVDYGDKGDAIVTNNLKSNWFDKLHDKTNYKKVIATQDQLSPEYIAKFIKQYNNGKVDDIEIEMEEFCDEQTIASASGFSLKVPINIEYKPKLTNGFVTIVNKEQYIIPKFGTAEFNEMCSRIFGGKPKQEPILYTEEEVLQLLYKWSVYKVNIELEKLADELPNILSYDEWFEQNKKK